MKALPGASASAALAVSPADTAPALASGDLPVLATPRLLALCEEATVAALAPFLEEGETTVGSRVELEHLAPSAPGARVEATAILEAVAGPRLTFAVTAREGDRTVGRGTIERVVVDRLRFLAQAEEASTRGGPA
ncbi:MAG TPA: thioesterase family protein [Acidimicrobiia bacterium]|nr:thioesterase family protein [Acidimicrobiia bacterium]